MLNTTNILVLLPMQPEYRALLQSQAVGANIVYRTGETCTDEDLAGADIIVGNPAPNELKKAARLRFLQLVTAGSDIYAAPGVLPREVVLANATGAYGLAIAEVQVGMLLSLYKKLHLYRDLQNRGEWKKLGLFATVSGSTVLVVGLGDLGGEFAKRIKALGATVIAVRRAGTDKPDYVDELVLSEHLDEVLPRADAVALCLPNTAATNRMFDAARIAKMKQGAVLLNVGRGNSVDTEALCDALESGHLGGAALDVTDPEPLPVGHRLWGIESAIITPHISNGSNLPATKNRLAEIVVENVGAFLAGRPIRNLVDPATGYRAL